MTCEGCSLQVECGWAEDIKAQAVSGARIVGGAWSRANWEKYITRMKAFRKQCERPDLLDAAMRSVKPKFIGE